MPRWLDWLFDLWRKPIEPVAPEPPKPVPSPPRSEIAHPAFPPGWSVTPITIEEAESLHPGIAADDERLKRHPEAAKPFGFMSGEWEALKAQMQPGDELFEFMSEPESWRHLAGRAGIALVRGDTIVADIVMMMN